MKKISNQPQGFSLIELSIVLGIMSIMATALVPNMIALHQEKLVTTTAKTYYNIADAAMAYAQQNGGRWPGYQDSDEGCDPVNGEPNPLEVLKTAGYLPTSALRNPWQKTSTDSNTTFSLNADKISLGGGNDSCRLEITSTLIPTSAKNMLDNLLTNAVFDENGGVYSATMQMLDSIVPTGTGAGTGITIGTPTYNNSTFGTFAIPDSDGVGSQVKVASLPGEFGAVYNVKCAAGETVVGMRYSDNGDDHITHMYCEPLIPAD